MPFVILIHIPNHSCDLDRSTCKYIYVKNIYLHVLGSLRHRQTRGGTWQQVQGWPTQEGGALLVPQAVPDQGAGTEKGDDLEGGTQAKYYSTVLGTVVVLGKHSGQRILGNNLTTGHSGWNKMLLIVSEDTDHIREYYLIKGHVPCT